MKKFCLALIPLVFSLSFLYGLDFEEENFAVQEEMYLGLESEIEALIDEQLAEEAEHDPDLAISDDDLLLNILESEIEKPLQERSSPTLSLASQKEKVSVESSFSSTPLMDLAAASELRSEEQTAMLEAIAPLQAIQEEAVRSVRAIEINLREVFSGSPIIYTLLMGLSVVSLCVWLYSMLTVRSIQFLPPSMVKELRTKLVSNQFDEALDLCVKEKHFFCKMLASGILARRHGLNIMLETMKSEGKRSTIGFWQRISILNEIAVIAPMIGLLGTVMGMFYAFYDLNRSMESVSLLFDGLGISVGTTVAGLSVAILSMILHTIAKYRLVRTLAHVENEAQTFATMIDAKGGNFQER